MKRNPRCACGCGLEVMKPTNKYVIGHMARRKLTDAQVVEIKEALSRKVSTYELARMYSVSQATNSKPD